MREAYSRRYTIAHCLAGSAPSQICKALSFFISIWVRQRHKGKTMKAWEKPMSGLRLEVQDSSNSSVVLSNRLIEVDPCHLPLGEVDSANVSNSSFLSSVHPNFLSHHQTVSVIIEDNFGRWGSSEASFWKSSSLKLCRIDVLRFPSRRRSSPF